MTSKTSFGAVDSSFAVNGTYDKTPTGDFDGDGNDDVYWFLAG